MTASGVVLPGRSAGNGGRSAGYLRWGPRARLAGRVANPDELRTDERVVHFVHQFAEAKKPIAAICHGPWTLIDADAGTRQEADFLAVAPDRFEKRRCRLGSIQMIVVDRGLVASRKPSDLPAFCEEMLEEFGKRRRRAACPEPGAGPFVGQTSSGDNVMATSRQKSKVHNVMNEHEHGRLKSGSGKKVKSRKQAVAIAMSEAGQSKKRKKAS